jgi:hypothetical protein
MKVAAVIEVSKGRIAPGTDRWRHAKTDVALQR